MLHIPQPCSENWNDMKIVQDGRFCDACQHNVMDFTHMSKAEVLHYLLLNPGKKTCGRLLRSQLDFRHPDFTVVIPALQERKRNQKLPLYALSILALLSLDIEESTAKQKPPLEQSVDTYADLELTPLQLPTALSDSLDLDPSFLGEIVSPYVNGGTTGPRLFAEQMPEFVGGEDSLMRYIQQHAVYPKWEMDNKIEGKVFVRFVVGKKGELKDITILRSIEGSKNFDAEAIRVVQSMPNWIPGKQNGKVVEVQYVLPFTFKL